MTKPSLDMTGRKIGHLTVLGRAPKRPRHTHPVWYCQCQCGTVVTRLTNNLRVNEKAGYAMHCGCDGRPSRDSCIACLVPLVRGQNWNEARAEHGNRRCIACTSKQHADWVSSHLDKQRLNVIRGRAEKQGVPFALTAADIAVPDTCPVLGIPLIRHAGSGKGPRMGSPSVDRKVPALGYVPGNVRVISHQANAIRGHRSDEEVWAILSGKQRRDLTSSGRLTDEWVSTRVRVAVWLSYGQEEATLLEPSTYTGEIPADVIDLYRGGAL